MNLDFASVWETVADLVPENDALICGEDIVSWKDYDLRSSKIAAALSSKGLGPNSKAGLYLNNSNEYLIGQNAIFKIGGVPINVNYRYVEEELIYLLDNSDAEAVFYHACYSSRINEIAKSLPNVKVWIEVPDESKSNFDQGMNYEEILTEIREIEKNSGNNKICVCVIGIGRIGLPTALSFANSGLTTIGLDINSKLVENV